jgi:hypothetical protein
MPGISISAGAGGDRTTGAAVALDFAHHEIHEGDAFQTSYASDIAASTTLKFLLTVPNTTKWPHVFAVLFAELETEVSLYEAPTTPSGGSLVTGYNKNRNSLVPPTMTVKQGVATVADGTLLQVIHYGTGKSLGGEARSENEWVLKQNTQYIIAVTNVNSGSPDYCTLVLNWYEHTNL